MTIFSRNHVLYIVTKVNRTSMYSMPCLLACHVTDSYTTFWRTRIVTGTHFSFHADLKNHLSERICNLLTTDYNGAINNSLIISIRDSPFYSNEMRFGVKYFDSGAEFLLY